MLHCARYCNVGERVGVEKLRVGYEKVSGAGALVGVVVGCVSAANLGTFRPVQSVF